MILLPAIDLYGGKAVRLQKGEYDKMTVYHENPIELAKEFEAQGAKWLHTVDLEGAKSGEAPNLPIVERIAAETKLNVEFGGGVRNMEVVRRCMGSGVDRVILGTAAVTKPEFLEEAVHCFGAAVAAGADVKDGRIAIQGWLETAQETLSAFLTRMERVGVQTVICTDISRDGMLSGSNRALYAELMQQFSLKLIASGGVSSVEDIQKLNEIGLYGAILGKAYYTGAVSIPAALEAAK